MDQRFARWLASGLPFVNAEASEGYRSRVTRLTTAIRLLGTPDRVPIPLTTMEGYPAHRAGLRPEDGMYDFEPTAQAFVDFNLAFQPDALVSPLPATLPGKAFELIGYDLYAWAGHGAPKDVAFQYNEREWMPAEDYDRLTADPSDYLLRTYLPRVASGLRGLGDLGTALDPAYMMFSTGFLSSWADPDVLSALKKVVAAGEEVRAWEEKLSAVLSQLQCLGFPAFFGGASIAPFDYLGDSLRGTRGIMTDMYRFPEKVIEASRRLTPLMQRWVAEKTTVASPPGIFIPLHKGADSFMSAEQFKTFYWPTLLELIRGLNEDGFVPVLFAEGSYDSRLEIIAPDLPPGKTVWYFDRTDMTAAKRILGDVACIQGNVPLSILQAGTPEQVSDYCRRLLEVAAPGGGFLLDTGAAMHQGNDANLRAMMQSVHEFGV